MDWSAIRAEYLEGNISQRALAEKHGVAYGALRQRAAQEGWRELKRGGGASGEDEEDLAIARRTRRKLLMRLEDMADNLPREAVTEMKTQDDSAVMLFKLRDLTAAFKEVAGDLPKMDAADKNSPIRALIRRLDDECGLQ